MLASHLARQQMDPVGTALAASPSPGGQGGKSTFDYTFTDRELQDILGFMELQHGGDVAGTSPGLARSAGLMGRSPMGSLKTSVFLADKPVEDVKAIPAQLQFQPHLSEVDSRPPEPVAPHAGAPGAGYMPGGMPMNIPHSSHALPTPMMGEGMKMEGFYNTMNGNAAPGGVTSQVVPPIPDARGPGFNAGGRGPQGNRGPTVSHSSVEKQRRDRINNLIDELRDLVPPSSSANNTTTGVNGGDTGESKRPKHVVLSDTIALVKNLFHQVRAQEQLLVQAQEKNGMQQDSRPAGSAGNPQSPASGMMVPLSSNQEASNGPTTSGASTGSGESPVPLPCAPGTHENIPLGVIVDEGVDGTVYIKVCCEDRRGLLSDITTTIKSMPLEIKSAAITTMVDGKVYDVFEVLVDPSSGLSHRDIQHNMEQVMHSGEKRRRE